MPTTPKYEEKTTGQKRKKKETLGDKLKKNRSAYINTISRGGAKSGSDAPRSAARPKKKKPATGSNSPRSAARTTTKPKTKSAPAPAAPKKTTAKKAAPKRGATGNVRARAAATTKSRAGSKGAPKTSVRARAAATTPSVSKRKRKLDKGKSIEMKK